MHFVSQITLPPSEASRVTVTRVFQQPVRDGSTSAGGKSSTSNSGDTIRIYLRQRANAPRIDHRRNRPSGGSRVAPSAHAKRQPPRGDRLLRQGLVLCVRQSPFAVHIGDAGIFLAFDPSRSGGLPSCVSLSCPSFHIRVSALGRTPPPARKE
jgi:hypothetical protein